MADVSYADPAVLAFVALPLLLVGLLAWGAAAAARRGGAPPDAERRVALTHAVLAAIWMTAVWIAADSGVLREWDRMPPPFALLVAGILALSVVIALGPTGRQIARHLPLWVLVAVQAFRLPLELVMHEMYERGVMPGVMTYSGRNFDIVTGATAIVVAALVARKERRRGVPADRGRGGRALVWVWNLVGLALLVNVVTVAILATPRFRYFGDDQLNVWVTYPPFVWLPAVLVLAALAGHLVILRALVRN
jgi:hypothetical protein